MHTGQELGMILLLFVVTVLMFSSLEFAFEREGEVEAAVARQRDQVLYCTVLYCTVLYCTVLYCTAAGPGLELLRLHLVGPDDTHHRGLPPAAQVGPT